MTPIADEEIKRILVVMAHPDDCDFGAGGSIAKWRESGIQVSYCIITNGDQGGEESDVPVEEMAKVRQREQRAAERESTAETAATSVCISIISILKTSASVICSATIKILDY